MSELVLVTGATGYLAAHCVQQLLQQNYKVRGTVRSLGNESKLKPLRSLDKASELLELVEIDLGDTIEKWTRVVSGCDYILHVASPFPIVADDSVIQVAVRGTLVVMEAANKCYGVKKVVLTSSCAAINEGHADENKVFTEGDWTDIDSPKVRSYPKSKTLAEKAAWDFVKNMETGNKFSLTCLNPTLIVGPLITVDQGASVSIIKRFMSGAMPALPYLQMAFVDVRDVAKCHILAMKAKQSDGKRILVTQTPSLWFKDVAEILRKEFGQFNYPIPKYMCPYLFLWIYSFIDKESKEILDRVNRHIKFDNSQAQAMLGLEFRQIDESLIEMGHSLIDNEILPRRNGYEERNNNNQK
uniref:3Beta_HSD domain-containing protein n=1 Tax=Rhabditophanes sp. KR3021 TaxID=114890 RepID=A0AC35TN10_9BILA